MEFRDEIQSPESESHSKYSNLGSRMPEIELNSFEIKNYEKYTKINAGK